jgi:hypothetical protein
MMKLILSTVLAALTGSIAGAQTITKTGSYFPVIGGQYNLAVNTATSLTVPAGANQIEICVEIQAIRYRDDGTAPTSSVGIPVPVGTCFPYAGNLSAIQFIAQTAGATIDVAYYK